MKITVAYNKFLVGVVGEDETWLVKIISHVSSTVGGSQETILTIQMAPRCVQVGSSADHLTMSCHLLWSRWNGNLTRHAYFFANSFVLQALLDHIVYYLNITDANLTNKPKWQVEYSAKVSLTNHGESSDHIMWCSTVQDAFGLKSLQPAEWADLIERFEQDDALFYKFYQ